MSYLIELQKLRKKIWLKTLIIFLLIALMFFIRIATEGKVFLFLIIIISLIISLILLDKNIKKYKMIYKKNLVLGAFQNYFTDIVYEPNSELSEQVIRNTNMMSTGDIYRSNDYISAKYNGIKFECADVLILEKRRDLKGDTYYDTLFKGQWFIFDYNKNFKANIQICEKSFIGAKRGSLFSNKIYEKVSMEDVTFNKTFDVYAENSLDAFYVLTPHVMEKIKNLNNSLQGNLLFCLIDNRMYIGLHNEKDLFEPSIHKKINLEKEEQKILNDIKFITEFVDMLDLDNDLFKRRV